MSNKKIAQLVKEMSVVFSDTGNTGTVPAIKSDGTIGTRFKKFQTVADLNLVGVLDGETVSVVEYAAGTGLGGGDFIWVASSTAAPDFGGVFLSKFTSVGTPGRFHRKKHLIDGEMTPEDFGAQGNGTFDDYPAFMALSKAVTLRGTAVVLGRPKATYYYGQYIDTSRTDGTPSDPWRDIPRFLSFDYLHVNMRGATIKTYGGGYRTQGNFLFTGAENIAWWDSPIDSISGLTFGYGKKLLLENVTLDGNARTWTRWSIAPTSYRADGYPQGGAHLNEPYHQGINIWGVEDFEIRNVEVKDFITDGIFISHSEVYAADGVTRVTNETRTLPHRGLLVNVVSQKNRRQGMSVVGGVQITAINCEFKYTGHTGVVGQDGKYVEDAYGWHEPGAGVDIEPTTYPTNSNETYRVLETTGDITFINCKFTDNMNGPFVATYSVKIHGNIILKGCEIDGSHDWFPDSYVIMAPGVTMDDCIIRLPPNGFLWQDHDVHKIPENLKSTVKDSKIYIKRELGYRNPSRPLPLTIKGNRIYYPPTPTAGTAAIYFLDRWNGTYNYGGNEDIDFSHNRMLIPYTHLLDQTYGDTVAQFEGNMLIANNTWELTGTRPADLGPFVTWQIIYSSATGNGTPAAFMARPVNERYISSKDAPQSDWLINTPSGYKILKNYTFKEADKSYIPFGLAGEIPKGTTEITIGGVMGQYKVTDIVAFWGDFFQSGVTGSVEVLVNDVVKGTASWTAGQDYAATKTGLPFTLGVDADNQSLRIRVKYSGTPASYEMSNLKGFLALETL